MMVMKAQLSQWPSGCSTVGREAGSADMLITYVYAADSHRPTYYY